MKNVHRNAMRMADGLCKHGRLISPELPGGGSADHNGRLLRGIQEYVCEVPRIIMDDVHALHVKQGQFDWNKHAHRAIPPYPKLWAEFVTTIEGRTVWYGGAIEVVNASSRSNVSPECRFMIACTVYECFRLNASYFGSCLGMVVTQFDEQGAFIENSKKAKAMTPVMAWGLDSAAITFAVGISLMHHRSYSERHHAYARHLVRNESHAGAPLLSYKILSVDCLDRMIASGIGGIGDSEFRNARQHLVAGHWKRYSEDKPMFGRKGSHGWFWHDAHVRGNPELGTVIKDYAIATG